MMFEIQLNMYQAVAVAAFVLLLGRFLVSKFPILTKYCIPEPVVGGIVFALAHVILRSAGILEISFDSTLQTFFMTVFFCSVGFTACFRLLKKGGIQVVLFLVISVIMVVLQNVLGSSLASLFGLDPRLGLATGSIPMVGGHGTAAAFGPVLEEAGVTGANAVAIASATFGLVAGCMIGGPIAYRHIKRLGLHSTESATGSTEEVEVDKSEFGGTIDSKRFLDAALYLAVAIGVGTIVSMFLTKIKIMGQPMSFPSYIGAMVVAAVIRNVTDTAKIEMPMEEISTLGSLSLSLFLGLAMMGLKLWQLADLALPMIVMLAAQTILMIVFAYFIVFNLLGRNYDAAVMTTGFCGFGMGATPNAMANMQAVTAKYGPAPTAYFVVPLVGSLFIDFFNSVIITLFMNFLH
jgi:ESS family glutamate:Na+ symporter